MHSFADFLLQVIQSDFVWIWFQSGKIRFVAHLLGAPHGEELITNNFFYDMEKTIFIDGHAVVSRDENNRVTNLQFLPDDELSPILEQGSQSSGQLMMMRNGAFDFISNKPRVRANSDLIRKVTHGRLSGTRDHAFQLTLKCYQSEQIDWQKAFVCETIEALTDLMGPARMCEILTSTLNKLNVEAL